MGISENQTVAYERGWLVHFLKEPKPRKLVNFAMSLYSTLNILYQKTIKECKKKEFTFTKFSFVSEGIHK